MYNIYVEEKRKKELEDREKKRDDFMKYREKFRSKHYHHYNNQY